MEAILDKLLKKNDGVATAKHLYEYACSEMAMFFNDNGITGQQSVYDLARHLFEKLKYHGKHYVFKSNMYISLPEYSADSVIDIVSKYAREKGATVTYDELVRYLAGLGSNTGNLRGLMRIDKEPVFLIYAENEYLLAELMHIDTDFWSQYTAPCVGCLRILTAISFLAIYRRAGTICCRLCRLAFRGHRCCCNN